MTLPGFFVEEMRALLGNEADALFEALEKQPVKGVRRNGLKIGTAELTALLGAHPPIPFTDDGLLSDDDRFAGYSPAHHAGLFYVQEPGAQFPVRLLEGRRFRQALDLCAAPGGKSGQLAALCETLYANETVYKRAPVLAGNLERLGVRNAVVTCNSPADYADAAGGAFDLVLVDAPCSGEGMFRKEPRAVADYSAQHVAACAARSSAILESAAACVAAGGFLLYSTCTFNRIENEGVLTGFLARHADFRTVPVPDDLRPYVHEGGLEGAVRLLPHRTACEGQFACLLRREGGLTAGSIRTVAAGAPVKGKVWLAAFRQVSAVEPWEEPVMTRGRIVLSPRCLAGLNVLASGVAVASADKNVRPCHSLALALRKGQTARSLDFAADAPELYAYLKGSELAAGFTGWGTVTLCGYPLGLVKASSGIAKNHYPKGLYNRIDPLRR